MRKVIVISGPTASGKTDLSLELARTFGGEVVNFDSLLLYKEITIGTAKPTPKERGEIPHHMIDVASIREPMNASDYARLALPIVEELLEKDKLVFLVGGSGFYLQALLKGMYDSPTTPPEILARSEDLYRREGITPFREFLKHHDSATWNRYHENDHYRNRRAVEHFWTHGTPFSEMRKLKDEANERLQDDNVHGWELLHVYLNLPKEEHLEIIRRRTERMLREGLIQEVQELLRSGFTGHEKPLQSIGYKEVLDLHFGHLQDLDSCRDRIIISTWQLAKSQKTWFNRTPHKIKLHPLHDRDRATELVREFSIR